MKYLIIFLVINLSTTFAGRLDPIVKFSLSNAADGYDVNIKIKNDLFIHLDILHKNKKVAGCDYNVDSAFDQSRSRSPGYTFELSKKQCNFVAPLHEDKIKINESAFMTIKKNGMKKKPKVIFRFISDQVNLESHDVTMLENLLIKEIDSFYKRQGL